MPTVKKVHGEELEHIQLLKCSEALAFLIAHKNEYTESVVTCTRDCIEVQHHTFLTDVLLLLVGES